MIKSRGACIFCNGAVKDMFDSDKLHVPQSCTMTEDTEHERVAFMPFNLQKCDACETYQTKYLADLGILYSSNHYVPFGALRQEMLSLFSDFVCQENPPVAILEIGGGNGELFSALSKKFSSASALLNYTIIDPAYIGPKSDNLTVVHGFYEDVKDIDCRAVVMSHVFEHFYDPVAIINKMIQEGVQTIFLCHPDYDAYVNQNTITFNVLHAEHTFYISNAGLISLFEKHGFNLMRYQHHRGYSVFFEFSKREKKTNGIYPQLPQVGACEQYINTLVSRANHLNTILANTAGRDVYMWPCSIHSNILFAYGLRPEGIKGMLDNSSFKIGKYTYGHGIPCFSYEKVVTQRSEDEPGIIVIINGGCFTRELNLAEKANIKFIL